MHEESIFPVVDKVEKIELDADNTINVYAGDTLIRSIPTNGDSITAITSWHNTVYDRYIDDRCIDGELVPMLCTQCGGRLDPDTLCCKFCGTYYKIRK